MFMVRMGCAVDCLAEKSAAAPGATAGQKPALLTQLSEGFPLLRRGIVAAIGHEVGGQAHQRIEDPAGINRRCAQNDFIAAPESATRESPFSRTREKGRG